jgi:TolB-like protein/Tfp pilus assembly protein PilF
MVQNSNSIERFWKELKRRKVAHVITVYAAVSFVILQLVDIVEQPLRLPSWTTALVIVLLCIGFIIAVFVSWIYDITPAGVKKTKPVSAVKHDEQITSASSSGWKIATYVSGAIILALVAFNFISKRNLNADISKLEKSIAVIPFRNDSPNDTNAYFINGLMEKILNNLQMVKDLRVISRTSVEQYRNATKSIPEIAKEQDVNFIVEGSGQKYGNTFSVSVQLIKAAKEDHLWGKSYEQEIKEVKDILYVQNQIASAIITELKATLTPEEKQLIEKTPTTNLTAYDFYQRAKEEIANYGLGLSSKAALIKAENLYRKALEYDSTFAGAYSGLAMVYGLKHVWDIDSYFEENYLDSAMILANQAISHDDQLAEAYYIRGLYYIENSKVEQAIREFEKALKYNPNYWEVYAAKAGYVYAWSKNYMDYIKAFENLNKAISINHGKELPQLLRYIGGVLSGLAGFEKGYDYYEEAFKLDGDTNSYLGSLAEREWYFGNREKAKELYLSIYKRDSSRADILYSLGADYMYLGQYKESLKYFKKYIEREKVFGAEGLSINIMHRIGYDYWKNGDRKEAEYYFNEQKKYCEEAIKKGRRYSTELDAYYDLAGVHAFMGDKGKAYENLKIWATLHIIPLYYIVLIKDDPLFNSIRNEPEFQQIVRDVEAKYQAEHERVGKWLEEQGIL